MPMRMSISPGSFGRTSGLFLGARREEGEQGLEIVAAFRAWTSACPVAGDLAGMEADGV